MDYVLCGGTAPIESVWKFYDAAICGWLVAGWWKRDSSETIDARVLNSRERKNRMVGLIVTATAIKRSRVCARADCNGMSTGILVKAIMANGGRKGR